MDEGAWWDGTHLLPAWRALIEPAVERQATRCDLVGSQACGLGRQGLKQVVSGKCRCASLYQRLLHNNVSPCHCPMLADVHALQHLGGPISSRKPAHTVGNEVSARPTESHAHAAMLPTSNLGSSQRTWISSDEKATPLALCRTCFPHLAHLGAIWPPPADRP